MCNRKKACAEADAAKQHVGEWCLQLDARHAHAVQFVMDEAMAAGIELTTVDEVLLFAVLTVERFMAARASFDLVEGGK